MGIAALILRGPTDRRPHHPTIWFAPDLMMPLRSRWWVDAGASRAALPSGAWERSITIKVLHTLSAGMTILGGIPLPLLSLSAFTLIIAILFLIRRRPAHEKTHRCARHQHHHCIWLCCCICLSAIFCGRGKCSSSTGPQCPCSCSLASHWPRECASDHCRVLRPVLWGMPRLAPNRQADHGETPGGCTFGDPLCAVPQGF